MNAIRYLALKVASDHGVSRYRLAGPADPGDKGIPHPRYGWPEQVILVLDSEYRWRPVVTLSVSALNPGKFLTDAVGIAVEDLPDPGDAPKIEP